MSYNLILSQIHDERPDWFKKRFAELPKNDKHWIWNWNELTEFKVSARGGRLVMMFEDEKEFIWFRLKYE